MEPVLILHGGDPKTAQDFVAAVTSLNVPRSTAVPTVGQSLRIRYSDGSFHNGKVVAERQRRDGMTLWTVSTTTVEPIRAVPFIQVGATLAARHLVVLEDDLPAGFVELVDGQEVTVDWGSHMGASAAIVDCEIQAATSGSRRWLLRLVPRSSGPLNDSDDVPRAYLAPDAASSREAMAFALRNWKDCSVTVRTRSGNSLTGGIGPVTDTLVLVGQADHVVETDTVVCIDAIESVAWVRQA